MSEIENKINNDLYHNKNKKIKYEISKPSYLIHPNPNKLLKNASNRSSNSSRFEEKGFLSYLNKKVYNKNNIKNHKVEKNQNSIRKKNKENVILNKEKANQKENEQRKSLISNKTSSPKMTIESPIKKNKIHKRINSLHINNVKENKKSIKLISNKINNNKKEKLSNNKNTNSIDYSLNHRKNINNLKKNNKIIEPTVSSSNNLSFSSENKKSTKNENSNSLNNKNYNEQMKMEESTSNDIYFSFHKNMDSNLTNFSENEQKSINSQTINNNTLSGKIASRAKNLNKMLEENFNNLKKERKEKQKEKLIKSEEKSKLSETMNTKTISINDLIYNSISDSGKNNHISINRLIKPKPIKPLSSELEQKKQKMQHKTASLNHSLELRKKNKINDNNDLNINYNLNRGINAIKLFSKNDFRQMNTSPFVRSKPPIREKHTNYLPRKSLNKKSNNNKKSNKKSIDNKYNSPQKDISGIIPLDNPNKIYINKKPFIHKKKKVITKRKNKSMIIDKKLIEKNIKKINHEKEDYTINLKSKLENENKSLDNIKSGVNNNPINIKRPVRAQSQQEISTDLIMDNINEILKKNSKEIIPNNLSLQKIEKKIIKIQSLCKKGFAGPGIKKTNQDNFFIYNNFNNNPNYLYLGVCDGHGMFGQDVSGYLVNTLPQNMNNNLLAENISSLSTESTLKLYPIISSTFVSTNIDMIEDERVDSTFSGSTCVSLFYTPERLICANVGDSRCILGKFDGKKWKSENLSRDQKPSEQDEYERIINCGGRIESFKDENGNYIGPERVWLKDEDVPGLAMSRSFGDEVAHTVGVSTEPEIKEYFFLEEDKFIIIASDGLWEFISSDECVEMVKEFYLNNDIDGALNYLYKESSKRWIMEEEVIDDITILMAFLK